MSTDRASSTASPSEAAAPLRIVWPASHFYWSIIGASREGQAPLGRARPSRDYLDSLAEDDLPLPLEVLHVVHLPIEGGRFLACAVPKANLARLPSGTISLTPSEIPAELGLRSTLGSGVALPELLVREFEPAAVVRERSKRWLLATAACAACAALGMVGLLRRTGTALDQAEHLRDAARTRAHEVLPGASANLDLALGALQRELADLRPTHAQGAALARSPDAGATLAEVLAHLPSTASLRTDVLAVTPGTITLNVATDADPQPFLRSLVAPSGWTLVEPRLTVLKNGASTADATTTLAIQMRRAMGGVP